MTDTASTIVKLGKGAYPDTPLEAIPGWYLGMVLGGAAADCPWDGLTLEQQDAVVAENKRRKGAAEETAATAADAAAQTASDARVEAAVDAAVPTTGKGSRKAKNAAEGTVTEAHDIIAGADLEELGVIEKAENAGKNRVTVHAMIDKRKAELQPAAPAEAPAAASPSP